MRYKGIVAAVIVAVLIRALIGYFLYGGAHDIKGFGIYAQTMLEGGNVYLLTFPTYVYGPPWMFILELLKHINLATHIPFYFLVKVPAIIADGLIVAALHFLSPEKHRQKFAWLYALNPVSIMVTSVLPMFDATALLFAVLAFLTMARFKSMTGTITSAAFLAIGILFKTFPVFLLPLFVLKQRAWTHRLVYAAVTILIVVSVASPFLIFNKESREHNAAWRVTVGYGGPAGMGYQKVLLAAETAFTKLKTSDSWANFKQALARHGNYATLLVIGLLTLLALPFLSTVSGAIAVYAAFLFITSGFGPHYLLWLVPFGILHGGKFFKWYTILATVYLVATAITWQVWMNPPLAAQQPSPFQYVSGAAAIALWALLGLWVLWKVKKAMAGFSLKKAVNAWLLRNKTET